MIPGSVKNTKRSNPLCFITEFTFAFFFLTAVLYPQQAAFPTAEGSGMYSSGGRGGDVYEVTNLSNSGPGSIVDAVSSGNRTIVFKVSGTIALGDIILQPKSNTTIAGQTAPGDGICLKGRILISASNIIIRYIRVRVDAGAANSSGDAVDIAGGSNIIIDHVSASYARDEGISCRETSNLVTVQWCIISEALTFESHSFGSLVRGDYGDEKTYHHNLYAHNVGRLPRPGNYTSITTDPEGLHFDFRNNVVYNWGTKPGYNDDVTMISRYNFIGNAYIKGPTSPGNLLFTEKCQVCYGYFENNSYENNVPDDPWSLVTFSGFTADQINQYKARSYLVQMRPVKTTSPAQAKIDVLASAGASLPNRDIIDKRIIEDVKNKTGGYIKNTSEQPEGAWPALNSVAAKADDDHDGMPNDWELAYSLNPNNPDDRNTIGADGYTMLERYLNSLTGETPTNIDNNYGANSFPERFSLLQNYPNPFNPATKIKYSIPAVTGQVYTSSSLQRVTLKIYDLLGRELEILVNEEKQPGNYEANFEAKNLSSGIYFYKLQAGDFVQTKKMILIK